MWEKSGLWHEENIQSKASWDIKQAEEAGVKTVRGIG